jgi:hypothetical protein
MFISNTERIQLRKDLDQMTRLFKDMNANMIGWIERIKTLESIDKEKIQERIDRQKERQREYNRRYKTKKKLEKQNGNSVSTESL